MDKIRYTYTDYISDINALEVKLKELPKEQHHDVIVGINRGGCLPAVNLSHVLNVPCTMIDWSTRDGYNINVFTIDEIFKSIQSKNKRVLIVDDILDSGKTMKTLLNRIGDVKQVDVAVLIHNIECEDLGVKVFSGWEIKRSETPEYFDFFWEI